MRILVACEESQAVTVELRRLGHEAFSCDIVECSGGHPEWHICQDVIPLLSGDCLFYTVDGKAHHIDGKWDMILAFPPCTHLAVSGARWFEKKRRNGQQQAAIDFFLQFAKADCAKIAIENPVGVMSTYYRKPDQIIQPWEFGHPAAKTTCLWLKGLQHLIPTEILENLETGWENQSFTSSGKYAGFKNYDENGKLLAWNDPRTARIRSKTYPGIAKAMADQWAGQIE